MARTYGSFLIRYWRFDGGEERIEIQHLQSGGRTRIASLQAAVAWLGARCGDLAVDRSAEPADRSEQERG